MGHEEDANPEWLQRAADLSSSEAGLIQLVSLEDLVTRFFPERRKHVQDAERKWQTGEIPMSLAADLLGVSPIRLLLDIPRKNENEPDARRWVTIPIVAGGRKAIALQEDWTIGLDFSSVLVLAHLGLLEKAINSFHHVKLAPSIMEHMLREIQAVHFHQPSRVHEAQQVITLKNQGRLALADKPHISSREVVDEVGTVLGNLLNMARKHNGKVICTTPDS